MKNSITLIIFIHFILWILMCNYVKIYYKTKNCYIINKKEVMGPLQGRYISFNSYGVFYQITYVEDKTGYTFYKNVSFSEYQNSKISTINIVKICPENNAISLLERRILLLVACGLSTILSCFIFFIIFKTIKE